MLENERQLIAVDGLVHIDAIAPAAERDNDRKNRKAPRAGRKRRGSSAEGGRKKNDDRGADNIADDGHVDYCA